MKDLLKSFRERIALKHDRGIGGTANNPERLSTKVAITPDAQQPAVEDVAPTPAAEEASDPIAKKFKKLHQMVFSSLKPNKPIV